MTHPDLIGAGEALAHLLARENAALLAMDLSCAGPLVAEKAAALAAFQAAQRHAAAGGPLVGLQRARVEQLGMRLQELAQENQRLLKCAIHVQGRVLKAIAGTVPSVVAPASRYGATGASTTARRSVPVSLSARV